MPSPAQHEGTLRGLVPVLTAAVALGACSSAETPQAGRAGPDVFYVQPAGSSGRLIV